MSLLLLRPKAGDGPPAPEPTPVLPVPLVHARVAWRPQQHNRVINDSFTTDTTGWSVSAGINAAGTSIDRSTAAPHSASGCGRVVTTSTPGSGVNWDFGSQRFAVPHVALVWLRRVSGGRRVRLIFGSEGTAADRASLDIVLTDTWQPWRLTWSPAAVRTDVQLAIVSSDDIATTVDFDDVNAWMDGLTQLEWDPRSTAGWLSNGSGVVGSSATHGTNESDSFGTDGACHTVTTTTNADSGVEWRLGTRRFLAGRTYRFLVGLRRTGGGSSIRLRFGSVAGTSDRGDRTVAIADAWQWHHVDWTPAEIRHDAFVAVSNGAAASVTLRMDEAESFEAHDIVVPETLHVTRGAGFDGRTERPGTIDATLIDPAGILSPRDTSSPLAGSIQPRRQVHVRATWQGRLHGLAYGLVEKAQYDTFGRKLRITCIDGLGGLDGTWLTRPFGYVAAHEARRSAMLAVLPAQQLVLATDSTEASPVVDGTDDEVRLLDYLDGLNEATGSIHWCAPASEAVRPWQYRTLSRATLTSVTMGQAINEDFQRIADASLRDEMLITRQRVSWVGYDGGTSGVVVEATPELPYLTYTDDEYGSSQPPQPEEVWKIVRTGNRRRRGKPKLVGTRWVDTIVPLRVERESRHTEAIDFLMPMSGIGVSVSGGGTVTTEVTPAQVVVHIDAGNTAATVTGIEVTATPWKPRDEQEAVATAWDAGVIIEGREVNSEHVPSGGAAEGLADYITWRYGESRLRPSVIVQHFPTRQLALDVGSHGRLTADRWHLDDARCIVRGIEHEITKSGREWETTLHLEELPATQPFFALGGGTSRGFDSSAVLAH